MKKHIVCFGDSNTHGYCADSTDCADGGDRFNEDERWTCLLQKALGDAYLVIEEGLSGRTTVFDDPLWPSMSGAEVLYPILTSHAPIDLLIVMLGTNDTKERLSVNAACIAVGMDRLLGMAEQMPVWGGKKPNILLVAPPPIGDGVYLEPSAQHMGAGCAEKSRQLAPLFEQVSKNHGCAFVNADGIGEFNQKDCMHFTRKGHADFAAYMAKLVPTLLP